MRPARFAERSHRSGRATAFSEPAAPVPAAHLVVGAADDRAEVEADRVAADVIARLGGEPAHRHDGGCEHDESAVRRAPTASTAAPEVGTEGGEISPELSDRIERKRGSGGSLDGDVRGRLEAGFGSSLADVRVHADVESAELNRAVSARAFTVGKDIFFGAGEYRPDSPEGERVLAHEVAHTQQSGGAARRSVIRRWDLGAKRIDWSRTTKMGVVPSKQSVYFMEDASGQKLAVKSESQPIGLAELAGKMHERLSGVSSVRHRPLDGEDVAGILAVFRDRAILDHDQWSRVGAEVKADRRDVSSVAEFLKVESSAVQEMSDFEVGCALHAWKLDGVEKMVAMSFAEGDTAGKAVSKPGGGNPYEPGEKNRLRTLLSDYKHVQHLGLLSAVDLFLGNNDRVYAGNLGNWIYDPHSEAMTVIDHVTTPTANVFKNRKAEVPELAKKSLKETATYTVESLQQGSARAGDTDFRAWLDADGGARRQRMEEAILRGLEEGRKVLTRTFTATRFSGSSKARAVKKAIKQSAREAVETDQTGGGRDDYYETLKRRAEWLKKH